MPISSRKLLTADEAIKLQWETIGKWQPSIDVWPFKYGVGLLAVATSLSGAYFNAHYRKVTKLRHYGQLATLLPAVVMPAITTLFLHTNSVSSQILISGGPTIGRTNCPLYLELRAISIQIAFGVAFPLVVTPLGVFSIAARQYTYPVPPMWPLNYFLRHWWKITSPRLKSIVALVAIHGAVAALITRAQYKSLATVNRKLDAMIEREADELLK